MTQQTKREIMIKPQDIEFHTPTKADYLQAETNFFGFTIPEERLMGSVYTVTRKGLGVTSSDVVIFGSLAECRSESLYLDNRQHLPAPERLSDYSLPSGLNVKAFNPREYRVDYVGFDDTEIHFDFKGLMEPFDIHDPSHSPMVTQESYDRNKDSGFGSGYGGHFDLTGHVTGRLKLRGKEYKIDCVETMDHSWGARPEIDMPPIGWMHAHFGKDLAFHWIHACDFSKPVGSQVKLAHGYVMEKGEVYGLTDLNARIVRNGVVTSALEVTATDKRGKTWQLYGTAEVGSPWVCYVSTSLYVAMVRWTLPNGRVGYGITQENQSLQSLVRAHGKRWTDRVSRVAS